MITLHDVQQARGRIAPYIVKTPLLRVPALDEAFGCEVYLKPENFQITGSFKLRGATNKLLSLNEEQRQQGIVCASSGNHAQGCAYAAQKLGIEAIIIMPENCSKTKLEGARSYGATVLLVGTKSSEREEKMREIVRRDNKTIVHPYADDMIQAGQGTIALEVLEDEPAMDVIVVPVGGGGLLSGIAIAAKSLRPDVRIIGVEPEGACRYTKSLQAGEPVSLDTIDTIADGTRTDKTNPENLINIQQFVDELVTVNDEEILDAMKLLAEKAKIVAEPSSSMPVAAGATRKYKLDAGKKVCFIVSGGNNDFSLLSQAFER